MDKLNLLNLPEAMILSGSAIQIGDGLFEKVVAEIFKQVEGSVGKENMQDVYLGFINRAAFSLAEHMGCTDCARGALAEVAEALDNYDLQQSIGQILKAVIETGSEGQAAPPIHYPPCVLKDISHE